jgi:predicted TIM-barrel fold metal-dependent hydrolase
MKRSPNAQQRMSRRDFLQLLLATGGALAGWPPNATSGDESLSPSQRGSALPVREIFDRPPYLVVDMHTHLLRHSPVPFDLEFRDTPRTAHYTWHPYDADLLIDEMDLAGVDKAVVKTYEPEDLAIALKRFGIPLEGFDAGEAYARPLIRKYPDRLLWAKVFNPTKSQELPTWKGLIQGPELKVVVFRPPHFPNHPLTDSMHRQVFDWCAESNKPVMMTFESIYPPETPDHATYLGYFREIVESYPQLRFSLMHTGFDEHWMFERLPMVSVVNELNAKHKNIWVETAIYDVDFTYPYRGYLEKIHTLYEAVGRDRIMWGTDWPWTEPWSHYFQLVQCIVENAHFLSPTEKQLFFGGNAATFLGLQKG